MAQNNNHDFDQITITYLDVQTTGAEGSSCMLMLLCAAGNVNLLCQLWPRGSESE